MFRKIRAKLIKALGGYVNIPAPEKTPTIQMANIEKLYAAVSLGGRRSTEDPLVVSFAKSDIAEKLAEIMLVSGCINFKLEKDVTGERVSGTVFVARKDGAIVD